MNNDKEKYYGTLDQKFILPLHNLSILTENHKPYTKFDDAYQTDNDPDEEVHWELKKEPSNDNFQHLTTNGDTMIHLIKGNIGTGILAMPQSFKNAGLLIGSLGTLVLGTLCVYTMHMLVNCSKELAKRSEIVALSFGEVAESAFSVGPPQLRKFSRVARTCTNVFLYFTQLGICCIYLVFVADNLHEVVESYYGVKFSVKVCMVLLLVPLFAVSWIQDLKNLAPLMMVADCLTALSLALILVFILQDLPPISERQIFFTSWSKFPLFFSTTVFAFEGIAMVLPLQNSMKNPKDFGGWNGVLNKSMSIVLTAYFVIGFFGYLKYGENVKGSITLNLPLGTASMLAELVRLMMATAIFLSYALQFYVPIELTKASIMKFVPNLCPGMHVFAELAYRTCLVFITFLLAELIPDLGLFISLIGALTSTTLSFIFPPIFNLLTNWTSGYGTYRWILWKDMSLILFGVFACVTGTIISSSAISKV